MTSNRVTRSLPHFSHFGTPEIGALLPRALLGTVLAYYIIQSFSSDFFTMQYAVVAVGVLLHCQYLAPLHCGSTGSPRT